MQGATPRSGPRFVVSLDFELMWGVRETRTVASYGQNILGGRQAIPRLLALFGEHGVRATWATVGMLLFDRKADLLEALPEIRPTYAGPGLDPYPSLAAVGEDERSDPFHFGLSLARQIAGTEGMELASHTFSHYFALEPGQTAEQFAADLAASVRACESVGGPPTSIVFPRNQVNPEYLAICRAAGLTSFRGTERGWMYRPGAGSDNTRGRRAARLLDAYVGLSGGNASAPTEREGMVDVPSSRFLRPYSPALRRLDWLRVRRITSAMETAARSGRTFHLWWHPHNFGAATERNLDVLRIVLRTYQELHERYGMESRTMAEAAAEAARP
jgi:peptidoglycan/xylan/chitin deacetylase (PgdA/CDA1 family)